MHCMALRLCGAFSSTVSLSCRRPRYVLPTPGSALTLCGVQALPASPCQAELWPHNSLLAKTVPLPTRCFLRVHPRCPGCSFQPVNFWENTPKVGRSTRRTSPSRSRFRPWLTAMNRSSVSRRMMAFRPTFSTGSLPQSTSFRMVLRPMPVHSAASSIGGELLG